MHNSCTWDTQSYPKHNKSLQNADVNKEQKTLNQRLGSQTSGTERKCSFKCAVGRGTSVSTNQNTENSSMGMTK